MYIIIKIHLQITTKETFTPTHASNFYHTDIYYIKYKNPDTNIIQ